MATGIPTKYTKSPEKGVTVAYDGKEPVESILKSSHIPYCSVGSFGKPGSDNRFYFGDNLNGLLELSEDPEVCEKINLVYIDPPFSTGMRFEGKNQREAYTDYSTGGEFVEFLRKRLVLIHRILSPTGSVYVHLDQNMIFEIKLIMDEIFGQSNFRGMISRQKCSSKNTVSKTYGNITDYILFYTKSSKYTWNPQYIPWDEATIAKEYNCIAEDGRRFKKVPIHAPGVRKGETGKPWRGMLPPPGKHWQYTPEKLDELDAQGRIYWSSNGNPRKIIYAEESKGTILQDIWQDCRDSINQNDQCTGYPTEKNIDLLKRIIIASSNEGDLVLDCFSGSGTTLDAAQQLKRKWIGMDIGDEALRATIVRFTQGLSAYGDYVKKKRIQTKLVTYDVPFTVYAIEDLREIVEDVVSNLGVSFNE